MSCKLRIRQKSFLNVALLILVLSGCDAENAWIPDSPSRNPVEGFTPTSSHSFNDWTHVFMNEEEAKAKNPMGMAVLLKEGNFELPFNVFSISAAGPNYVETQYEVLYYDKDRTQIRVVEAEGDQLGVIMNRNPDPNQSSTLAHTFIYPGAKVRIGRETYEIRADGWYLAGVRVHAFETQSQED